MIDTSNEYTGGRSEALIGDALRRCGGVPEGLLVATKLDRDPTTGSFAAERMRRSLAESTGRLGLTVIPLLYLHDPHTISFEEAFDTDGPVRALLAMKEAGTATSIGISGGPAPLLERYVGTGLFDAVITHNRFTLVDRSAEALLDAAAAAGVAVVNAAVFGGGALAAWPKPVTNYAYRPAHPHLVTAVAEMGAVCHRAGVRLSAAALRFSTRDPRLASTVVGATSLEHLNDIIADHAAVIPDSLLAELDELAPNSAAWLEPPTSRSRRA